MMEGLAYMLLAYVVGSIPSGLIIGKVFSIRISGKKAAITLVLPMRTASSAKLGA